MADEAPALAARLEAGCRPVLRGGVRLAYDEAREQDALLYPEGVLLLNETAGAVLKHCDGARTVEAIAAELAKEYSGASMPDVLALLDGLAAKRLIAVGSPASRPAPGQVASRIAPATRRPRQAPVPLGLVAELTYRCPLRCPYCSNPVDLAAYREEMSTEQWCRVLDEARELGVLQVHLSGGEPLARRDLAELVAHSHRLGMYTSLVTSGVPLTVNAVLHRGNIGHVTQLAELAERMGADRLELANTQYYGWARRNWPALLPARSQVAEAERDAQLARARLGARMEIVYVLADYYEERPKPCMYGWGTRQLILAPNGDALPCPAAGQIPGLGVANVRNESLSPIWYSSPAFNRFRGTGWLPEPCRSCPRKEADFGGCRCQAYQLTGDAGATDPVCALSPHHDLVTSLLNGPPARAWEPRMMPAGTRTGAE